MRATVPGQYPLLAGAVDYLLGSGGKRIRPALVLLASRFYPADRDKVIALAAGWELLHTATLVHDDFIDSALMRRGNPTLNATWSDGATVLTGDFLFARSAALAAETGHAQVMATFANTLTIICNGELRQMFSIPGQLPTLEEYYERIYAKTASLFAAAVETGALLTSASPREVQALRDYGYNVGMAFQIVDDILDYTGAEEAVGKPLGSDLRQGVITLPALHFIEAGGDARLVSIVARGGRYDEEVRALIAKIRNSGSIEASLDKAREFTRNSQAALAILPDNPYRQSLHRLADFVVERQA
jgi:geranylgeranyl pyrophosphate synthase